MKERKIWTIFNFFIDVCLLSLGLWGAFLLVLFAKRSIKEFSFGWGPEVLLGFASIGLAYLIIIHYRSFEKKEEK